MNIERSEAALQAFSTVQTNYACLQKSCDQMPADASLNMNALQGVINNSNVASSLHLVPFIEIYQPFDFNIYVNNNCDFTYVKGLSFETENKFKNVYAYLANAFPRLLNIIICSSSPINHPPHLGVHGISLKGVHSL